MSKKKIWLVDDDNIYVFICRHMMKHIGHDSNYLRVLDNGLAAYEALQVASPKETPELILLDLNMPCMNGWGFIDSYREMNVEHLKNIKIVILSSSIDPEDQKRAKKFKEVEKFISKPISVSELRLLIT